MRRTAAVLLLYFAFFPLGPGLFSGAGLMTAARGQTAEAQQEEEPSWLSRALARLLGVRDSTTRPGAGRQEGVIDRYYDLYSLIHQEELAYYDSLRRAGIRRWDRLQGIDPAALPHRLEISPRDTGYLTFGWHPYWMGSAYKEYNFRLLDYVSWFSYNVDSLTGSYDNPDVIGQWETSELVDLAHAQGCKVLLTVSSHRRGANRRILDNDNNQQRTLIDSLLALLDRRQADGVDLNFENVPRGYEKKLTYFIRTLSGRLKTRNPNYRLSVVLPQFNEQRIYQIDSLQRYVDFFVLAGYDFHTRGSRTDGPVAPLRMDGSPYSIENSVFGYLEQGLERKKLLLGLPYYGSLWNGRDDDRYSAASRFDRHLTYRELKTRLSDGPPAYYDPVTWSAYVSQTNLDDTLARSAGFGYRKVWFDDTLTLRKKYEWVIEQGLGGVGIWALGYDHQSPELWQLLDDAFSAKGVAAAVAHREVFSLGRLLGRYAGVLFVAGVFLVLFLSIGLTAALTDWRVREVFFEHHTLRLIYIVGAGLLVAGLYLLLGIVRGEPSSGGPLGGLLLGLALGISVVLAVNRWYSRHRSRLP